MPDARPRPPLNDEETIDPDDSNAPDQPGPPEERARRRRVGRQLVAVAIVVGILVAATAVLGAYFSGGPDGPGADGGGPDVIASASGLALTGVTLTDGIDPVTGDPIGERQRFETGESPILWVGFHYDPAAAGRDVLRVVWLREVDGGDPVELSDASLRLPQPVSHANVTLGAGQTQEPGTYAGVVYVNDTELTRVTFPVGAS